MEFIHIMIILLVLAALANMIIAIRAYFLFLDLIEKIQGREEKTNESRENGCKEHEAKS